MAALAFFQKFVNGAGFFWKSVSASSFGIYFIHLFFLIPLVFFFAKITFPNAFIKPPLVIILCFMFSWGFTALVLRKTFLLKKLF